MKTFLNYMKTEIRRLRTDHDAIVDAAYRAKSLEDARAIEQDSAMARLVLADEMEMASILVKQSISAGKKLNEMGALQ